MKTKQFRWLLLAMTVSLTGLVALQAYWLKGAANAERKQFEETVRKAMTNATVQLETSEAYTLITEKLFAPENTDSITVADSFAGDGKRNIRIIQKIHNTTDTIIENYAGVPVPPNPPDPPPVPTLIYSNDSVSVSDTNQFVMIHRVERLKSAVKGVWREYIAQIEKNPERTNLKQTGQVLSQSLRNAGITDTFSFGIYSGNEKKLLSVSDSSALTEIGKTKFRVPLFPDDIHPDGDKLLVFMHTGNGKFLLAVWPQFLIAVLLTFVLIFVFGMTYREAIRQKKISEIRNDFINNMTHEFKTPIATISLATDTVVNPAVIHDAEKVRHYADLIRRENKRMNDQVEKVLELALAERNELHLSKETIDLDEVLEKAIQSMNLQANAKGSSIRFEANDPLPVFNGDPFHMERAFTNLLDNAIKYSAAGSEITVCTKRDTDSFSISFSDKGIGISEEDQQRIFDRFFRVSTGNRHDVKGFGLGLTYVKTIVEKHGGSIKLESKTGSGSTFTIRFPL